MYDGNSPGSFATCTCTNSKDSGFYAECSGSTCGVSYKNISGSPTACADGTYCPTYSQCSNGNCALGGPDADCACAAPSTCIGKCCPSTGKCKAASCDGNKINNPSGHEHECVVYKDGTNRGGQCPWTGYSYGVRCSYRANCSTGIKNNCWGYTTCGYGTCPDSALGVFCIESGNSDNFKICGCPGANPYGVAANCTALTAPQIPPAVAKCTSGNCASPGPDLACTCADTTICIGKCCPSTGKCQAASCDGNKINSPSGHEHECVVRKDGTNGGGQCPWSGQAYGVKCSYLANCSTGVKNNCWGYTTCALGSCPNTSVGVFCIESGNSKNFKVCGCSGEGSALPSGAVVAAGNCTPANVTVIADVTYSCSPGYYCPTTCTSILCPCGSYCPAGSTAYIPCASGAFCPAGSSTPPNSSIATSCAAGYYCPVAASSPQWYCNASVCPCGYYCPAGSTAPTLCPPGKYCDQNVSAGTTCPCGSYCPPCSCSPSL